MKLEKVSGRDVTITFSTDELAFICNAINETVHSVPKASFRTRTTETLEGATAILDELGGILDTARGEKSPHDPSNGSSV
jgi:hypothetical protein